MIFLKDLLILEKFFLTYFTVFVYVHRMNLKMKKICFVSKRVIPLFLIMGLSGFLACASTETKGLGNLSYSPSGEGFSYKSTEVPLEDFKSWASKNQDSLKKTLNSLDKGYVLEIVGHTDSSGPREAEGEKKGNIWYSTNRAKAVFLILLDLGMSESKLRYVGVADDEILNKEEPSSQVNRRVSFRVRPK